MRPLLLLLVLLIGCSGGPAPDSPTVAAAASLRTVMPALIDGFGGDVTVTYGGSGTLRQQVEGGAPIDVVLFAAPAPVDSLISKQLADPATRVRVATNDLVLIGPTDAKDLTFETLGSLAAGERIAVGEPGAVPAGRYTKEALTRLGTWGTLQPRIVFAGDVAAVLAYARRGEVGAAAVYRTDAAGIDDVRVLDVADWEGAPRPEVVGAAVSDSARGRAFLQFVASPAGAAILERFGFGPA